MQYPYNHWLLSHALTDADYDWLRQENLSQAEVVTNTDGIEQEVTLGGRTVRMEELNALVKAWIPDWPEGELVEEDCNGMALFVHASRRPYSARVMFFVEHGARPAGLHKGDKHLLYVEGPIQTTVALVSVAVIGHPTRGYEGDLEQTVTLKNAGVQRIELFALK